MKRIYPDDMQLDQFLVLNETDYKVLAYCLDEMSIHVPVDQEYNKLHISQEEFDAQKDKLLKKSSPSESDSQWVVTLLLAFLLGVIGAHRFYVGKTGTGILMLFTFGGLGIWLLIDLILIITGQFTNKDGEKIARI